MRQCDRRAPDTSRGPDRGIRERWRRSLAGAQPPGRTDRPAHCLLSLPPIPAHGRFSTVRIGEPSKQARRLRNAITRQDGRQCSCVDLTGVKGRPHPLQRGPSLGPCNAWDGRSGGRPPDRLSRPTSPDRRPQWARVAFRGASMGSPLSSGRHGPSADEIGDRRVRNSDRAADLDVLDPSLPNPAPDRCHLHSKPFRYLRHRQ